MTRTDKVQAYNALGLAQRRKNYEVGTERYKQCMAELVKALNKLSPKAQKFVAHNYNNTKVDWVEELSKL